MCEVLNCTSIKTHSKRLRKALVTCIICDYTVCVHCYHYNKHNNNIREFTRVCPSGEAPAEIELDTVCSKCYVFPDLKIKLLARGWDVCCNPKCTRTTCQGHLESLFTFQHQVQCIHCLDVVNKQHLVKQLSEQDKITIMLLLLMHNRKDCVWSMLPKYLIYQIIDCNTRRMLDKIFYF